MTRATMAGTLPIPRKGMNSPNSARDGMVCKIPASCRVTSEAFLYFTTKMAKGTASKMATKRAIIEICTCSNNNCTNSPCRSLNVLIKFSIVYPS